LRLDCGRAAVLSERSGDPGTDGGVPDARGVQPIAADGDAVDCIGIASGRTSGVHDYGDAHGAEHELGERHDASQHGAGDHGEQCGGDERHDSHRTIVRCGECRGRAVLVDGNHGQ
jgi:hypothetical protein